MTTYVTEPLMRFDLFDAHRGEPLQWDPGWKVCDRMEICSSDRNQNFNQRSNQDEAYLPSQTRPTLLSFLLWRFPRCLRNQDPRRARYLRFPRNEKRLPTSKKSISTMMRDKNILQVSTSENNSELRMHKKSLRRGLVRRSSSFENRYNIMRLICQV